MGNTEHSDANNSFADCDVNIIVPEAGSIKRYRGCMVGALAGDCIGFLFELPFKKFVAVSSIFKRLHEHQSRGEPMRYSDDTCMRLSIARSLLRRKEIDPVDIAKEFSKDYYEDRQHRGYGGSVPNVFRKWEVTNHSGDIFAPAREQFDGKGSLGNGGAMRIAPIPLFFRADEDHMLLAAKMSSELTHTHPEGYNGAILLAYATHLALVAASIEPDAFLQQLIDFCAAKLLNDKVYINKLKIAKDLLKEENVPNSEIVTNLGTGVFARNSVVTAIYCALRGWKPIKEIESGNPLVRTILLAVSLGGDCDTIATMAAGISGAYYGIDAVPGKWRVICDGYEETEKLAEELFAQSCAV